jgi:hypothetical protein
MKPSRVTVDDLAKRGASKEMMLLVQAKVRRIGRDIAGHMVAKALHRDLCDVLTAVVQALWASHAVELGDLDFLVVDILPGDADGMVGASLWVIPRGGKPLTKQASRIVRDAVRQALLFIEARTYAHSDDMFTPSVDIPAWFAADEVWRRGLGPMSRAARRGKQPLNLVGGDTHADVLSPTPIPPGQPELLRQTLIHGVVDAYKRSRETVQILGHEGEAPEELTAKQRTFTVKVLPARVQAVLDALQDAKPRAWTVNVLRVLRDGCYESLEYVLD